MSRTQPGRPSQDYRDGYRAGYHLEPRDESRSARYQDGYINGQSNRIEDDQDRLQPFTTNSTG
jgi:hypothetical protein